MSRKNYTNYSREPINKPEEKVEEVIEETVEVVEETEAVDDIENEVKEIEVNDEVEYENTITKTGVVSGCSKLRVRRSPSPVGEQVTILNVGTTVEINVNESTVEFFKIKTKTGVEGFCMNKFITLQ